MDEVVAGMCLAYPDVYAVDGETARILRRTRAAKGKVGVVSGGGFGHIPVFAGYVGDGLLDACAVGDVFASPDMNPMLEAVRFADTGAGVLCIVGNYGGDRMNFDMTCEMAEMEDIATARVIVSDDVASAGPDEAEKRRGVAGLVYVFKIAGAAAKAGMDLAATTAAAQKASNACRSIGVAMSSCTVPQAGKPTFEIGDMEIEIGMGIHGEPGVWRGPLQPVDAVTDTLLDHLDRDRPLGQGDRVSVLVNGLGATPVEELFLIYRRLHKRMSNAGVEIVHPMVGNYATSMEMAGASVTIMKLDGELEQLLSVPADCPFWRNL
ncbi:dihydroxyacetone kinase subunit DhaK [Pelagibius litoralis]|uniref:dihydroxyacetone kinase subunit DhaK n=1 Tax=Pelagibius litoralis TaxID=374515 RepID=UPI002AC33DFC|nr:dihydroxyacetone kinase subunit DhaK [Pelagibius litoralis]